MSEMKKILLVMGISMMAALAGCAGKEDENAGQAAENIVSEDEIADDEISEAVLSENGISENEILENEAITEPATEEEIIEIYSNDDMEVWVGEYRFLEEFYEEGYPNMFMDYHINIYEENDIYYADVVINGQMTGINAKARLYGNAEWASLVLVENYPENTIGLSDEYDNVILSLRRQDDEIYTYWGLMTPLLENEHMMSGNVYLERKDEPEILTETAEGSDMDRWLGEYAFSEKDGARQMDYHIDIYEENDGYYADIVINGPDTGIDLKARIYGDEEWISLVLMDYNAGHENGWEDLENSVLFSLRRQGEKIYTYWGEDRVLYPLLDSSMTYHYSDEYSNEYFERIEN